MWKCSLDTARKRLIYITISLFIIRAVEFRYLSTGLSLLDPKGK